MPGQASSIKTATGRELSLVGGLLLLWLLATAWMRPLALPDEGRYVGVAWEMMRSGEWLTPTLNGLPFFHKPPLFYWITASSLSLFGMNEWAARAAPILGAWMGGFALYLFVRRWSGERATRLTLLMLGAQPLFYIGGQFANLDMLVAGCISSTILLAAHTVLSLERGLPYQRALLGAYAMAALGFMSKGLIGAVLPIMVIVAWLVLRGRWRELLTLLSLPGMAIFLLLTAPWFAVLQLRFPDFLNYFFVVQQFKRFATGGFNGVQPYWFYPGVLAVLSLPAIPWLRWQFKSGQLADADQGSIRLLMWLWLALITLFFSLPASKLLGYILPVMPPLAFLVADGFLNNGTASSARRRWWGLSVLLSAAVGLGVVGHFTLYPRDNSRDVAAILLAQRGPQDAVLMLNDYYYDLAFYARLPAPVPVVNDWGNPELRKGDDGRKEMLDGGQFDTERAARTLLIPQALPAQLCRAGVTWVLSHASSLSSYPFLRLAPLALKRDDTRLWKVDSRQADMAAALGCVASQK